MERFSFATEAMSCAGGGASTVILAMYSEGAFGVKVEGG